MARPTPVAAALAAGLLIAACGSSSGSGPGGGTPAFKRGQAIALANCMRSHGVPNFPDPGSNGRGGILIQQSDRSGSGPTTSVNGVAVNGPAFQAAMQACRKYQPNGGTPSAAETQQIKAKALAMAHCMRTHGVPSFPDPQFQAGPGGGFGIKLGGAGIDPQSPAFQAAQKACGGILGDAGGGTKFRTGP